MPEIAANLIQDHRKNAHKSLQELAANLIQYHRKMHIHLNDTFKYIFSQVQIPLGIVIHTHKMYEI